MLQDPDACGSVLEEADMTLIVTIQTDTHIVIAADGMAYSGGDGGSTPYHAKKLQVANKSWVFGFTGYAGPAPLHAEVEAEIAAGRLILDTDLDMSARPYFEAICRKMENTYVPPDLRGAMILAGRGHGGLVVKKAEIRKVDNRVQFSLLESDEVTGYGSKSSTAKAIIEMFIKCCPSPETLEELAIFSIWRVALQELTVGRMENDYEISTCILGPDDPPQIKNLPTQATLERMRKWKECLERACSSFLASASSIVP